jgi:outer membrane protein assembly factor BamB
MIDRHHRGMSPLVVDGRMFIPGNERLKGVDAHNGTILWDLTLPGFRRVAMMRDSGHLAARKDEVFAVIRDSCRVIDAATGRWLRTLSVPLPDDYQREYWGYLAVIDDAVLGTSEVAGASYDQHDRAIPARISYWDNVPLVVGRKLFSLDRRSGEERWVYRHARGSGLRHPTIVVADRRIFFVESRAPKAVADSDGRVTLEVACAPGASWLVALDLNSGEVLWERPFDLPQVRHALHAVCAENTVILAGTHNEGRHPRYDLLAFNAADGKPRWATHYLRTDKRTNGDHGEQDQHPVVIGKTLYTRPWAFDVLTGKKLDYRLDRGGHGCGGLSGSACYLFGRGGNPRMYELDPGTQSGTAITQVSRPGCWINMIAADGLLLIPEASSGCSCALSIQASLGLAPQE